MRNCAEIQYPPSILTKPRLPGLKTMFQEGLRVDIACIPHQSHIYPVPLEYTYPSTYPTAEAYSRTRKYLNKEKTYPSSNPNTESIVKTQHRSDYARGLHNPNPNKEVTTSTHKDCRYRTEYHTNRFSPVETRAARPRNRFASVRNWSIPRTVWYSHLHQLKS